MLLIGRINPVRRFVVKEGIGKSGFQLVNVRIWQ